jgi:Fibronectin type III domain/Right handed beta helix region
MTPKDTTRSRLHFRARSPAVLAAVLFACIAGSGAQVYVSPTGNDEAPGTLRRPVRTLAHARDLVRSKENKQILLEGGVYRLSDPLVLSQEDSGTSFAANKTARPILSGAVQVTGWTQIDAERNLWKAPAPNGLTTGRQMYVNGVRAYRAKRRAPIGLQMTPTGYTALDPAMGRLKNVTDIEFVYTGGNSIWSERSEGLGSWTEPRCPIAAIDSDTITMAQPCWNNSTQRVMLPSGAREANLVGPKSIGKGPAYVENAYGLLGKPGEWYFDRPEGTLYYVPRAGEDLKRADVEVPFLESLVNVTGTASEPAHDITFSGIEFSYATWLGPSSSNGFSEIQANYQVTGDDGYLKQGLCTLVPEGECPYANWTKTPGNVSVAFGKNIRFLGDTFAHLGAAGLDFASGTQGSVIEGCIFTDISGNGLQLGGVEAPLAPPAEFTSDNRIENNLFRNVGAEYRGGIGIVVGYAQRTVIAHNELDHLPYAGISIGWGGWPDKIKQPGQANNSGNNLIASNSIHDFMLVLSDGGGIYTQGRTGKDLSDGEKVTGNVIYNQYSSGHGIYTDNGSAMITISKNVLFNTNHDNINSRHRDYYDGQTGQNYDPLVITDNWWEQGDVDSDKEQVREQGNRIIHSLTDAPADLVADAGLQTKFRAAIQRVFETIVAAVPPEPPSRVAAYGMKDSAYVTWGPPVFDGRAPVLSYIVTDSDGTQATIDAAHFSEHAFLKFNSLTPGQIYTFTVRAVNAKGESSSSLPSASVITEARKLEVPGPPASVSAFVDHGRASIHFQTPSFAGLKDDELPILAYAVTVQPTGRKVYLTGRNVIALQEGRHVTFGVIDDLTPGENYRFSVSAINDVGEGEAVTVPGVPVSPH